MLTKKNVLWYALTAIFLAINIYMLFHNLGRGYLIQTDEAYHATNAYEMFKQDNWIVNTYRYATDYFNSKPPLCLDIMVLSYKIFGISAFAARFPSALFGLITCIAIIAFLLHDKKTYAAAFFPMFFGACSPFFTFHMYRAAEMDALYNLFFVIAMISLYKMSQCPNLMYVYGLSLGLAFMCKGPHSALIFIIGLLYIPKCKEAFKSIKRIIISALLAAFIPCSWMVKRYMFDKGNLLNALFVGEVADRVSNSDKSVPAHIARFLSSNIFIIFVVLLIAVSLVAVVYMRASKEKIPPMAKSFLSDNYLFVIWVIVPVLFFSFTDFHSWYIYTLNIALCILSSRLADYCITEPGGNKPAAKIIITAVSLLMTLFFIIPTIKNAINTIGTGGNPIDLFTNDIQEFGKKYDNDYSDINAYLIPAYRTSGEESDHWDPEYVAPAEMYADLVPVDGTVDNFLSDPDSILILDKDLWDEYSSVLTGHVILYDNSYLIFSNEMY